MTAYTQSGYPVIDDYGPPALVPNPEIPGTNGIYIAGGICKGDPTVIFVWIAEQWHYRVEPISSQDDGQWGYTKKQITGGSGWSNHAGGVAIDLNAARHPQGTATLNQNQIDAARSVVNDVNRMAGMTIVDWGGEWSGSSKDQMHFQFHANVNVDAVGNAADAINALGPSSGPEDIVTDDDIQKIAKAVWEFVVPRHSKLNSEGNEYAVDISAKQTLSDTATYAARASKQ